MPLVKTARYKEFLALLRKRLPDDKVSHCVFVAEYMASFAGKIQVDHDAAVTAGLLHDLFRTEENEELLECAGRYRINISDEQHDRPVLLHGPVAAEYGKHELGIEDEDIYEAMYWHTTGRPGYCRVGQALYVADFSEPRRKYPEAVQARAILRKEGFDAALRYVVDVKNNFVQVKHGVHPDAYAFQLWVRREFA